MNKKIFCALFAAAALTLVSCSSIDSKISQYEKACENGEMTKASKILIELREHEDELSDEQAEKILKATAKLNMNAIGDVENAMEDLEDLFN